jgi:hypothetical protein
MTGTNRDIFKNLPGLLRVEGSPGWSSATVNPAASARHC